MDCLFQTPVLNWFCRRRDGPRAAAGEKTATHCAAAQWGKSHGRQRHEFEREDSRRHQSPAGRCAAD